MTQSTLPRPRLADLPDRRAPALHRTLPTWARQALDNGQIVWRIYVPHRLGGALFMVVQFGPTTPRSAVAVKLREHRKVLWGRDKVAEADSGSATAATSGPSAQPADGDPAHAPGGVTQGALF